MEKKDNGLKILVIVLGVLVLGLTAFIVYDKVLNNDTNTNNVNIKSNSNTLEGSVVEDNTGNLNQVIEEVASSSNNNSENNELDFSTLIGQLKDTFQVIYKIKNGSYAYCGNDASKSDKVDDIGNAYYVSSTYTSYDDMVNSLKKYATEDALSLKKENYIEENGKLYCKGYGKSNPYQPVDYVIQIDKMDDNKIFATVAIELANSGAGSYLYANYKVEYAKTGVASYWMITNFSSK